MEMAARLAGGCRPQSEPMKILHPLLTFIGVILIFHQATGVANPVFLAAGMTLIIGARLAMLLTPAPQKKSAPVNSWEREVRELFYADKIEVDELERLLEFAIRGLRPVSDQLPRYLYSLRADGSRICPPPLPSVPLRMDVMPTVPAEPLNILDYVDGLPPAVISIVTKDGRTVWRTLDVPPGAGTGDPAQSATPLSPKPPLWDTDLR
jgi:hypothetical protein